MKKYKPLWVKPETHKKVAIKTIEDEATQDEVINKLLKNEKNLEQRKTGIK